MEWLASVPWGELTAYLVLLVLTLWIVRVVIAALVRGEIVPAKHAEQWRVIAVEQQKILADLEAQSAQQLAAISGVKHLVEAALPPRPDDTSPDGGGVL